MRSSEFVWDTPTYVAKLRAASQTLNEETEFRWTWTTPDDEERESSDDVGCRKPKKSKNQKFIDLFVCFSARHISKKSLTCADMHQVELGRIAVRDLNEVDTWYQLGITLLLYVICISRNYCTSSRYYTWLEEGMPQTHYASRSLYQNLGWRSFWNTPEQSSQGGPPHRMHPMSPLSHKRRAFP